MSMPRFDYARCRECNRPSSEAGTLSHTRLCAECGTKILAANVYGIHEKRGPAYMRRQYGIALREFGPRVALALKQAGLFEEAALDDDLARP